MATGWVGDEGIFPRPRPRLAPTAGRVFLPAPPGIHSPTGPRIPPARPKRTEQSTPDRARRTDPDLEHAGQSRGGRVDGGRQFEQQREAVAPRTGAERLREAERLVV
uniref:Uncharacterized protein n=1 Tax=Opuntia streptacantha TaxID=393608 RepID=A0A7C8ZNT2_OPUST